MSTNLRIAALALAAFLAPACAPADGDAPSASTADELRPLSEREALEELAQVGDALRANYAPLEYKRARFGFELDAALADARAKVIAARTEGERIRPFYELLAKLKDGHVSLRYRLRSDASAEHSLPITVTPVAGSYLVESTSAPELGIVRGDKLVSIDGMSTAKLEELLLPLAEIGTPESSRHAIGVQMTSRPFYAPDALAPRGDVASVVVEHADGTRVTVAVPWKTVTGGVAGGVVPAAPAVAAPATPVATAASGASDRLAFILERELGTEPAVPTAASAQRGASTPWFLTPEVRQQLGVVDVAPKAETLASLQVTVPPGDATIPEAVRTISLRAYKYRFAGKTILLVRIPRFSASMPRNESANVGWLSALLQENLAPVPDGAEPASLAETPADAVVLDVTHNPGGSIPYAHGIATLFLDKAIPSLVQASRADRLFISGLVNQANMAAPDVKPILLDRIRLAETAYDVGNPLTPFMPIAGSVQGPAVAASALEMTGNEQLAPHPLVAWNRPVLVLQDELSGSMADAFPMLLQNGGVARTFGARTAGMGGTVAPVLSLPYSGGQLSLTRGLFGAANPTAAVKVIENVGVAADFPYEPTVADFRSGFVSYTNAFSTIAATLTR
jgi:hypothetical protein